MIRGRDSGDSDGSRPVHCAGLDISKKDAKVCVRVAGRPSRRKAVPILLEDTGFEVLRVRAAREEPARPQVVRATRADPGPAGPDIYLGARYRRIAFRRGPRRTNVAIQRKMLTIIWRVGRDGTSATIPAATCAPGHTPNEPGAAARESSRQMP